MGFRKRRLNPALFQGMQCHSSNTALCQIRIKVFFTVCSPPECLAQDRHGCGTDFILGWFYQITLLFYLLPVSPGFIFYKVSIWSLLILLGGFQSWPLNYRIYLFVILGRKAHLVLLNQSG